MKLFPLIVVLGSIWMASSESLAALQEKQPPESAAPSIDKDEKIQAALASYLKEEGHAKRAKLFFDLATSLGRAARQKPPIPEKAIFRYLGNPELIGYTGNKDAKGKWQEKVTNYAYAVDNKDYKAMPKGFAGEKLTVLVTVLDGNLVSVAFNDGVLKESPGFWEKFKK
jgi:hypothetical protein